MEHVVFFTPDEKAYEEGSRLMREAGYEETGKAYLRSSIVRHGRTFFCIAVLFVCLAGAGVELYLTKRKENELLLYVEQEKAAVYQKMQGQKEYIQKEKEKMGVYMENISHQLKTPLTGSLLCLENLLAVEENERKRDKLEKCIRQLSWMKEMTIVLLRLAQLDAGKIWLKRKRENLTFLLKDCIERIRILAEEKEITLTARFGQEYILSCDAFWIKEAVENVLKNAITFTPQNGVIRVTLEQDGRYYEIRIFNSGKKLDENDRESIFERFYQRTDKKENGFGIGLHLAREIIRLHQGTLKVIDTAEEGTTFQFRIPQLIAKEQSYEIVSQD
ncbi:HAMP domain-containing sensor histidine kinase [Roseburia hominis]